MLFVQSDHLCCVFLQGNWTALHHAAGHGNSNVISLLLRNGANVNITTSVSYDTNTV